LQRYGFFGVTGIGPTTYPGESFVAILPTRPTRDTDTRLGVRLVSSTGFD
jgi:hypothetical protein